MILGCGVDLMDVGRFEGEIARRGDGLLTELFSPAELARCRARRRPAEGYAMGYAAKEAVFKALGTGKVGRMAWTDIEIAQGASREHPAVALAGETGAVAASLGVARVHLALTCTRTVAAAMVVMAGPAAGPVRDVSTRQDPESLIPNSDERRGADARGLRTTAT